MEASKRKPTTLDRKIDASETALVCLQASIELQRNGDRVQADLYLKDALEYVRQALSVGTSTTVLRGLRKNK